MNFDVIAALQEILEEANDSQPSAKQKAEQRADDFVISSRQRGTHAKDKINSAKNEDEDESSPDIFDKAKKDIEGKDQSSEDDNQEKVETPDESPSTINLADAVDFNKLIKALNQFRASQSLTDKVVYQELSKYFHSKLNTEEKQVLYVLIKGLVQITLLDVDGKAAYAPSDLKFSISKKGSATSEKIKSIKKKQASKEKAKELDTSPIKIGDNIQEKRNILKIVKENNA